MITDLHPVAKVHLTAESLTKVLHFPAYGNYRVLSIKFRTGDVEDKFNAIRNWWTPYPMDFLSEIIRHLGPLLLTWFNFNLSMDK